MYNLYDMIFKRKSFRGFDNTLSLSNEEVQKIEQHLNRLVPLLDNVKIKYRIVKNKLQYDGLDYVIMLAFGKGGLEEFRKDYTKAKRRELEIIWRGQHIPNVTNVVRFAPSACNSQPWRVVFENHGIRIFRSTEVNSIFPKEKLLLYNCLDMGIFLYFLELALRHEQYEFERLLYVKENSNERQIEVVQYTIQSIITSALSYKNFIVEIYANDIFERSLINGY